MRRYPGLAPFTADQKDVFFGRNNDIQELSELIFVERKVLLYSKSGYGKTSLLNAGVIPKLSKNKDFEFITIRFRSYTDKNLTPHQTFLQTLRQHADFEFSNNPKTIIDQYAPEQQENYWAILKKNQLLGNKHKTYILIFDQFEELFTYPETQINEFKQRFAEIILEKQLPHFFDNFEDAIFENKENIKKEEIDLLYNAINIKSVFAIRSDRLSELNILADKITDIQKIFYELQPLNKEQAEQAIISPAKQQGEFESQPFTFEKLALKKIINALVGKGKIETTQLQIVCQRIEENIIVKKISKSVEQVSILNAVENDIPDFKDIFLDFYNTAVSKVKTDNINNIRKFIEDQLIIEGRRISLDEFVCQRYIKNETLKTLVETRLLRAERNSVEGFSYELSHDTLVPPIKEIADKRRERETQERKEKEEQERLAKLLEERKRQRKIITIVSIAAIVSIAFGIFGFVQMKNAQNSLKQLIAKDAYSFFTEERYIAAKGKYEQLIALADTTEAIQKRINLCIKLDSISQIFYGKMALSDSLALTNSIENQIKADSIYKVLHNVDYKPGKMKLQAKLEANQIRIDKIVAENIVIAKSYIDAGTYMYSDAEKILLQTKKLAPLNKEVEELLKKVQR